MRKLFMFLMVPVGTAAVMFGSIWILPDDWGIEVAVAIPLVLISALVLMGGFTLAEDYLKRWTKGHGLTMTDENRPLIRRYLLRGRRIRTVGALAGYVAYSLYTNFAQSDLPFGWVTSVFAGYLLGAAAAEVWALRPEPGAVRTASLAPREITDYVPRPAVIALRVLPIAIVVLAASWPLIPTRPVTPGFEELVGIRRPDLAPIIGWTAAAIAVALFIEATARRVVHRPQPASSEELMIVDDAIRSTALHGLYGAGLALLLGSFSRCVGFWTGLVGPDRLDGLFIGVMIVSGVGSLLVWLRLGIDQQWVVRRNRSQAPVAA